METQGPQNRPSLPEHLLPERIQHRQAQIRARTAGAPVSRRSSRAAGGGRVIRDVVTLSGSSPVRPEKVIQARRRIADGYYGKPEITEMLARALLESMGLDDD